MSRRSIIPFFRPALLIFSLVVIAAPATAQFSKIIHKTYPVETVDAVKMDIVGNVEVEPWEGSMLMIKTSIQLFNASEGILKHFLETGRYGIDARREGDALVLESAQKEREPIQRQGFVVEENISVKVFVPHGFEIIDETSLKRE